MACTADCRGPSKTQAHCGSCHKTFTGISTFDQHRVRGACVVQASLTEKNGVWGNWGTSNGWWRK